MSQRKLGKLAEDIVDEYLSKHWHVQGPTKSNHVIDRYCYPKQFANLDNFRESERPQLLGESEFLLEIKCRRPHVATRTQSISLTSLRRYYFIGKQHDLPVIIAFVDSMLGAVYAAALDTIILPNQISDVIYPYACRVGGDTLVYTPLSLMSPLFQLGKQDCGTLRALYRGYETDASIQSVYPKHLFHDLDNGTHEQ